MAWRVTGRDPLQKSLMFAGISGALISLLLLGGFEAYACEVLSLPSVQESYEESDAIFLGKVADFKEVDIDGTKQRVAFFEVDKYWKSPVRRDSRELVVTTAIDHGACGYDFQTGKTYLVYATAWVLDIHTLSTSIGMRTQPIENAQEDVMFLGEGKVPASKLGWEEQTDAIVVRPLPTEQTEYTVLLVIGIGVGIAGIIAFLTFRRLSPSARKI